MKSDILAHYRKEFLHEAVEILEQTSDDMLHLEANPDNVELLDSVFRGIHTIKGSAGVYEMNDVSDFTHHLEELLNALRDFRLTLTPEVVDVVLTGMDHINSMITAYKTGEKANANAELVERFKSFLDKKESGNHAKTNDAGTGNKKTKNIEIEKKALPPEKNRFLDEQAGSLPDEVKTEFKNALKSGFNIFRIQLLYSSEMLEHGYDPMIFLKNLKEITNHYYSEITTESVPFLDEFEPLELYLKPKIFVAVEAGIDEIIDLSFDPSLIDVHDCVIISDEESEGETTIINDNEAIKEFVEGATEWLEIAEREIIDYEENRSLKAINEIFRVIHNIKGDSAYLGLVELKTFTHSFESLLDRLRAGKIPHSVDLVDVILKSLDFVKQCIKRLSQGKSLPVLPPVFNTLQEYKSDLSKVLRPVLKESFLDEIPPEFREIFIDQLFQYKHILMINSKSRPLSPIRQNNIKRALRNLAQSSKFIGKSSLKQLAEQAIVEIEVYTEKNEDLVRLNDLITFIEQLEEEPSRLGDILVSEGKIDIDELKKVLAQQKPIGEMLVEAGKVSSDDVVEALEKQKIIESEKARNKVTSVEPEIRTMRIDEQKIEHFTNLVGEMLIARNTYDYLIDQFNSSDNNRADNLKALKENLHLFSRLTNELQHGVISLRMSPIKGIFQKFIRVVRDISRKQKKIIQLTSEGDEIEIDKKVADVLSDPMIHLIRNACDHGLETPEERKALDKPEKGTITLKASREGSNLCIRIIDDGRGIDREQLLAKAQHAGLAFESIDDPGLLDVIFMPGVSTKEQVSDISGRGVGMDVVKTTVRSLGGTVSVASEQNKGTEVFLSLPTTMGIETVLFVKSMGKVYAISIDYIAETLKIPAEEIKHTGQGMIFHYRGNVLAARSLNSLLPDDVDLANNGENTENTELSMVIVQSSQGKYGLIVDELDRNMEIAIKPAPEAFASLDYISGVSIMGDGKVILVLNPEKL